MKTALIWLFMVNNQAFDCPKINIILEEMGAYQVLDVFDASIAPAIQFQCFDTLPACSTDMDCSEKFDKKHGKKSSEKNN